MRKRFCGAPVIVVAAWSLSSCSSAPEKSAAATPVPEEAQVVGETLKSLYMAASAAPPQSAAQHKVILNMAAKASNGKELMLVMRAAVGVFPVGAGNQEHPSERDVRSVVTAKMMKVGTVSQMVEYARLYSVSPETARPYVERMIQLGDADADPRVWYLIRATAYRLKLSDLERQAQARVDQVAGR